MNARVADIKQGMARRFTNLSTNRWRTKGQTLWGNPSQGRYSPMSDVNLAKWTDRIVTAGQNLRQTDVGTAQGLADHGQLTAPDGGALTASGFIVNCPIVSLK